jgi:hypothetical protein
MGHSSALPFVFRRTKDVVTASEVTSTSETVHGLLHLEGNRVVIQWRRARTTDRVGWDIRTDRELEPVRELTLPLSAFADAEVRWSWLRWPPGRYLILTGSDLRAFEELTGAHGLQLDHPAELAIRIGRVGYSNALEFASELRLALADRAIEAAERLEIPGRDHESPDSDATRA